MTSEANTCVIVGAGSAGLGVACELQRRGIAPVVLERGDVGQSWRQRYDRLRLNTSALLARVPGTPFPRGYGQFPTRDEIVAYLEAVADPVRDAIRTGVTAQSVDRTDAGWIVETSSGPVPARTVVIATGRDHTPVLPDWPGRDGFTGELLHTADYRNATPFTGMSVVVVGAGNSGAEIALDLAEGGAGRVMLSIRTPPHIVRRAIAGIPNDLFAIAMRPLPVRAADAIGEIVRRSRSATCARGGLRRLPRVYAPITSGRVGCRRSTTEA